MDEQTPDATPDESDVAQADYPRDAKPWQELIKDAEKVFEKYQDKADKIDKLYASLEGLSKVDADREFQIFWANLEVLKPSIYAKPPVPVVVPKFKNRKELARKTADVLERTISTVLELDQFNLTMKSVRDDLATNARGVMWARYEAKQIEADPQETEQGEPQDSEQPAIDERVVIDHVNRKDFLHDPARKWKEVEWVARRAWLTREQGVKRFGDTFNSSEFKEQNAGKDSEYKGEKKAPVWEIWHKTQDVVVWITPGNDEVLDIQPPFLSLDRFFPCPQPAYGTTERESLRPVPDFLYYKDQVEEINELTARISSLAEALRMKGFYAGGAEDLANAIETALKQTENNAILIPVANFGALGGQGIKDSVVWLPIVEVATTIKELLELRRQLIDDVYQITGISDIMRGTTVASETLGAQQLKSQYGSVRVRDRQEELVRIARDTIAIVGEIVAENFQPETIVKMSQVDDLPTAQMVQQKAAQATQQLQQMQAQAQQVMQNPQAMQMAQANPEQAQQIAGQAQDQMQQMQEQIQTLQNTVTIDAVISLLRAQRIRPFVLDIETDSTIQPDEDAAKQRATEFVTAIGGFIGQSIPLVAQVPQLAPLTAEMLKFVAGQFRAGRELDGVIDDFAEQVKQSMGQQQQTPPDPAVIKAQADQQMHSEKMQLEQAKAQLEQQGKTQQIAFEKWKAELDALKAIIVARIAAKTDTDSAQIDAELQAMLHFTQLGHEQTMQENEIAAQPPPETQTSSDQPPA